MNENVKGFVSQTLSKNKERPQIKLVKGIKIFLKKRKIKSNNMVANDIKIFLSMKSKG